MANEKQTSKKNKAEPKKLTEKGEPPESVVPPSSGPDDVTSSAAVGGGGSVDPETGETLPQEQPYTGDEVLPAETLADGGPEPVQPTGSDEGGARPLDQTSAPGFKTEGAVAAVKAEAEAGKRAATTRKREDRKAEKAAEANKPQPGISVSEPRVVHTLLTITGQHFPPRKPVKVTLSASRTPSGLTMLRSDPDGTVQLSIYPVPGEQSVTFEGAEGASASADFKVADQA